MEQFNLDDLASFVLVARHEGFGKASRLTGRAKATLSRRVAALEDALQLRLVERGHQSFRLTPEGQALYDRSHRLLDEVFLAGDDIRNKSSIPSGTLRISAPMLFAHLILSQIVAEFHRLYPQLHIEVEVEDRFVDPIEEGYDIVVRMNPSQTDTLVGRRLLVDELLLVTGPDITLPKQGGKIPGVLLTRNGEVRTWLVDSEAGEIAYVPDPLLRLSTLMMIRDAVKTGAGAAVLPRSLVGSDLQNGALICWGKVRDRPAELWALHTSRRLANKKVSAFLEFLTARLQDGKM